MTTRTSLLIPLMLTGTMLLTGCQFPSSQAQPAIEQTQAAPTGTSVTTVTSTRTVTAEPEPAVTRTRTTTETETSTQTETETSTVTEHPDPVTTTVTQEAAEPEPVVQPTSSPSGSTTSSPSTEPAPTTSSSTTPASDPAPTRAARTTIARSLGDLGVTGSKKVALTFDDGPGVSTPQVLDVLTRHQVPATFFVVGDYARTSSGQQLLGRAADSPLFTVGGHSMHHQQMTTLSLADYTQDLQQTSSLIEQATGRAPVCMRPPYGATDAARVGRTAELGQHTVNWDVDPVDWEGPSPDTIAQRVLDQVRAGGSIVLLHDGGADRQNTVAALPQIISTLRAEGYEFVALPC